jgi:hypothetical protein
MQYSCIFQSIFMPDPYSSYKYETSAFLAIAAYARADGSGETADANQMEAPVRYV